MSDVRITANGPLSYQATLSLADELEAEGLTVTRPEPPLEQRSEELAYVATGWVLGVASGVATTQINAAIERWGQKRPKAPAGEIHLPDGTTRQVPGPD